MITVRRGLVGLPVVALFALAACDLVLGLGDLRDKVPDAAVADSGGSRGEGGDTSADGPRSEAGVPVAASCRDAIGPGLSDCGPGGDESCCATQGVQGGDFSRSNDATYRATVSSFYLDRFEVTVGRFRLFVDATSASAGFRPAAGSGKHTHLNDGKGLNLTSGGYESGWRSDWNDQVPTTRAGWSKDLYSSCDGLRTWTELPDAGAPTPSDARALGCVSWYQAYAFCIWDGGFLPTEAEWNYAAAGGMDQREYPWSFPPSLKSLDCSYANHGTGFGTKCSDAGAAKVGSLSPKGDGKYGQADLGGNLYEWTMDAYASPYANPCVDCVNTETLSNRAYRGGAFSSADFQLNTAFRAYFDPAGNLHHVGFRCARALQ